ncbi:MAG: hypothetical protein WC178_03680 [Candidatus Paceibacterota bacterium]
MNDGEIAEKLLLCKLKHDGVTISSSYVRQLGNIAKETGISIEELKEYSKRKLHELVDELHK